MFEVLGQDSVKKAFNNAFNNNKISHAYILAGPEGTGKSLFASYMAAKLLCEGETNPCEMCAPCIKVLHGNHPDLKVLSTSSKSTKISDIREIIDEIYKKPYEGSRRVVIIKKADTITGQGQNAILKTLEEPSEDTTIILLVENVNSMLPTIQSRCQLLRFGRINSELIEAYLIGLGVDKEKAMTVASLSDGIIGNALNSLNDEYMTLRNDTINIAGSILDNVDPFETANYFIKNKERINDILDMLMAWFRDIIVLKFVTDKSLIINKDLTDKLLKDSEKISYERADKIIKVIKDTKGKLKHNTNFQLAMEVMLLNMQEK